MIRDAMQRLTDENPVPASARAWAAAELGLDAAEPSIPPRRRRRLALAVAGVALLIATVLLVAPALGLGIPGIDFFKAEKAPPVVVKSFAGLGEGAPPGMDPNVVPGETRKVLTTIDRDGYGWILWVAPTREGGLCYEWQRLRNGGEAGCDKAGAVPLSVSWSLPAVMEPPRYHAEEFRRITGFAHSEWVDEVQIHLSDGSTVEPRITWVSEPISAGFFFYEPPPGLFIRSVVGLRDGEAVVDDRGGLANHNDPVPSPFADLSKKRALDSVATPAGKATVWQAPTRADMICRWVELAGKKRALAGCAPPTYDEGLPTTVIRVGDVKLLALYAPNRSSLWLRFANGSVARIHPHNGVALYEVRQPGSFVYVEARGAGAKTTLRFPVSLRSS